MILELLGSFKGTNAQGKAETWPAGTKFDDTKEKIPSDILSALKRKNPKIRVIVDMADKKSLEVSQKQLNEILQDLESANLQIKEKDDLNRSLQSENEALKERIKRLEIERIENSEDLMSSLPKGLSEGSSDENREETEKSDGNTGTFKCLECGREDFISEKALNIHMAKSHANQ